MRSAICGCLLLASCAAPLTVQPEPAGENCTQGGVLVSNGSDTVFVCNGDKGDRGDTGLQGAQGDQGVGFTPLGPVLEGSFQVDNRADLDALVNVTTITGDLRLVGANGLAEFNLPNLTSIQGSLSVGSNKQLSSITLPNLNTVGDSFVVSGNPLLPTCQVQNLLDQLNSAPANVVLIEGNDDTGVCP